MDLGLTHRRAIVTGGSKGLGLATVTSLIDAGANVAFCARKADEVTAVESELNARGAGTAHGFVADITNAEQVERFITDAATALGGVDILVNNAGGAHPGTGESITDEAFQADFNIKVLSWQRTIRATLPYLKQSDQARIITIGGGVCLLVVGLSLAIAALRDRSAGWLTALSVIGIIMAFPTAAIGTQAARPTDFHINVHPGGINTETTRDWTVDRVSGGNPAGTTVLDLTGAPVGTTKTIVVDWEAWSRLTIQVAEGQPVQIVCQSDIETLSTNMDGNGWASALNNCAGATATSPSWGKPSLGGITVLITDSAGLDTLTVLQTPDSSGTWGSKPTTTPSATPSATPSTTPSATPSSTPTGSQSGN